ncbi:3905_t:CDS:1, partial [Gigaspora rosea]
YHVEQSKKRSNCTLHTLCLAALKLEHPGAQRITLDQKDLEDFMTT